MEATLNVKRLMFGFFAAVVLFLLAVELMRYLHSGTIIITTNSANPISLIKLNDEDDANGQPTQTFTGHHRLSERVGFGQYIASVQGNSLGATQLIKLTSHKTLRYTINPINTTGMAPVAYQSAQNLAVGDNSLVYFNSSSKQLYQINSQNEVSAIGQNQVFQSVKWASASFGVAQDANQHLYVIDNGLVSPLNVPEQYSSNVTTNYSVAPDKQIYVSFGANVYEGDEAGGFKKIYTSPSTSQIGLIAGPNQEVLAIHNESEAEQAIVEIGPSGKAVSKDFDLGTVAWSPDGTYIASADEGGGTIYNNATGEATTIPNNSQLSFIGGLAWLNNTTLFYTSGTQIWVYNVSSRQSRLLANTPLGAAATEMTVSEDGSYLYVLTGNGSGNTAIRRIGLRGQTVPKYIYQLQDIFPDRLDNYSLSLVNFTQPPVVLVQPYPDAPPADYIQTATSELQSDGFDTSKLRLQLTSAVPGQ